MLASIVLVSTLVIVEIILRGFGYKPGVHTYIKNLKPVDSLFLLDGFAVDSMGIIKVDKSVSKRICDNIHDQNEFYTKKQVHEIFMLASESIKITRGEIDNELSHLYKTLSIKEPAALTEFENAVLEYIRSPINEEGFRSIPFKQYQTEKPKILLIGDSFTWGHSPSNTFNSFADELLTKGYVVYNTGISGADVAQYLAIAKQYIAILKPDVVIVNFYLGNDITYYKREVSPFTPVFFRTNAGHLVACPCGKYFANANEAYQFNLQKWQIPEDNRFNKTMAQTVITTLGWGALLRHGFVSPDSSVEEAYYNEAKKRKYDKPYCNGELLEIKEIAEKNNARFILSSIPEVFASTFKTKKDFPDLFEGLTFIEMQVDSSDYKLEDGHFNDKGHKRYADFLIQEIETKR